MSSPRPSPRTVDDPGTALRYELLDEAEGITDLISLGLGDPDLPTPAHIIEAAKTAIDAGLADIVGDPAGLPALRAAVATKLQRENGVPATPDGVVISTGGQEGLFLAVQAILRPGDEVLVPDPRYPSYDTAIRVAQGEIVSVPTYEEDSFDLNPEEVVARITPRTRVLLLVSPGNPTAGTISPDHVHELAEIACRHDLIVISDEIYEKLLYDDTQHLSIGSLAGMAERTITVNGFSKTYCMTGWRCGWVAGPEPIMREVARLKRLTSDCAPLVSQYAGIAALEGPQDAVAAYLEQYSKRRRIVLETLDRLGFTYGQPRGGFYVFMNAGSSGMPAEQLSRKLLTEAHVLIFPGTGFGPSWSQYMRLAWLAPVEQIAQAMERIERCLAPATNAAQ
ncbi:MAG: pyridoxal phosphate-dependent aminotransferase [Solirubrobacteraceae bacterium]